MREFTVRFWRDESGQDLVEYGLLIAILAVVAVATLGTLSTTLSTVWTNTNAALSSPS